MECVLSVAPPMRVAAPTAVFPEKILFLSSLANCARGFGCRLALLHPITRKPRVLGARSLTPANRLNSGAGEGI